MIGFVESLHWWIFAKSINWSILDKRIRLWRLCAGLENFVPKTRRVMAAPVCLGWRACARNNDISCRSVALGLAAMLLEARMAEARLAMNRAHSKSEAHKGAQGTASVCRCQCTCPALCATGTSPVLDVAPPPLRWLRFQAKAHSLPEDLISVEFEASLPSHELYREVLRRWPQRPSGWLRGQCEQKWILETPVKRDTFLNLESVPLGFISHGNVQVSVRPRVFGGDKGDPHLHGLHLQRHVAQGEAQAVQVAGKINSKLLSSIFD